MKKRHSMLFGVTLLAVCGLIAKLIGAFYKIPLMHILGTSGMGVYYLVFPVYSMMLTLCSSGVSTAVVRMVSIQKERGLVINQRRILRSALFLVVLLTVGIGLVLIVFSGVLSEAQGNISGRLAYIGIAPALVFAGLIAVLRGYFQGLSEMIPTSVSNLTEQIVKVALGLTFSHWFLQQGLEYGVFGAVLGITVSELVALIVMWIQYLRHKQQYQKDSDLSIPLLSYMAIFKELIGYMLPATFSSLIIPFTSFLDSFMVLHLLEKSGLSSIMATSLYGISNGVVATLINLPIVLSTALTTVFVPSISSCAIEKRQELNARCGIFVKITWIVAILCFVIYFLLAPEMINILYQHGLSNAVINEYNYAYSLLKISSITIIYNAFLHTFIAILQSVGRPILPCISMGIAVAIRTMLVIVTVSNPSLNIYGLVISNIVFLSVATLINLLFVRRYIQFSFSFARFVIIPSFAGLVAGLVIYLTKMVLLVHLHLYLYAIIALILGVGVYLAMIFGLHVFSKKELSNMVRPRHITTQNITPDEV